MQVSHSLVRKIYSPRKPWSHKGDFGRLLVVGGSYLYSGSPTFNAVSAYRSGCDLVKIAAPEKAAMAIKAYSPDMIANPLRGRCLAKSHVRTVLEMQKRSDAMVIGGGLTRSSDVLSAIKLILGKTAIPSVIDADALHAVSGKMKSNAVMTPNSYEFKVIFGKDPGNSIADRKKEAKAAAEKFNCTILLKGHVDVISDSSRTVENRTGSAFMTKGGFGDVLAGICGSLLSRGVEPFDAACAAAYISGRAGDMAARKFGEGVLASDAMEFISRALK